MRFTICLIIILSFGFTFGNSLFSITEANILFQSNAKLEFIQAQSDKLKGIINTETRSFAFSVPISSFEGFNSPLQRQHFNENYMESSLYKNATFTGKIIEKIDLEKNGEYEVRAKGKLNIHGITKERIIKSKITIENNQYHVNSVFTILLSEHDIDIPKVVRQKITEEILVFINAEFEKK